MRQLRDDIVNRFSVTPVEAERMITVQAARSKLKAAINASRTRIVIAEDLDFEEDPGAWRGEVQKRMQAIEIMEEGVSDLKKLQKQLKRIVEGDQKLIAQKTGSINKKDDDWWDMQHSGWAMGGREMFIQSLCNILRGLDESKIASYLMDKLGFKRSIPIDEEDVPPLIPEDIEPGQSIPAYEEDPAPEDAEGVESMLVSGAKRVIATTGHWVIQKRSDGDTYAFVIGSFKHGGNKAVVVNWYHSDRKPKKAKVESTKNWYPKPKSISTSDIPKVVVERVEDKIGSIKVVSVRGARTVTSEKETPISPRKITLKTLKAYPDKTTLKMRTSDGREFSASKIPSGKWQVWTGQANRPDLNTPQQLMALIDTSSDAWVTTY